MNPGAGSPLRLQRRASDAAALAADKSLCPEYCEAVDAAVRLLEGYRAELGGGSFQRPAGPGFGDLAERLWRDWRAAWSDAFECVAELAGRAEQMTAAKRYTEAHLTGELLSAPIWRQAYTKPRGYSGDYVVMRYIYDGAPVGNTVFARLAHALAVRIGEFVLRRKDLVRDAIADTVRHGPRGGDCRIVSLGCGPASEVADFAASGAHPERPVSFVLVDHDEEALRFAGRSVAAALGARDNPPVRIGLRKLSALRLLRDLPPADAFGNADLIYSAGLFDYFSDRTCRLLTRRLYEALRPGGMLLLGNMKAGTDMLWPLYLIADWSLHYRSAESVMDWARDLPGAEISLRTETTGYDYMLGVRKPA